MALIAVLEFGDNNIKRYSKQYLVSNCRFLFNRPYNAFRPDQNAKCNRVEVDVVAPGKEDLGLFEWFASQGVRDGRILISLANEGKVVDGDAQVLYFNDAKCFTLSELYDIDASRRRILKLGITAAELTIDDVVFYNR